MKYALNKWLKRTVPLLTIVLLLLFMGVVVQAATPDAFITKSHESLPTSSMADVAYGNGVYVAVGSYGAIIKSTDTDAWVNVRTLSDVSSYNGVTNMNSFSFSGVAFGNGLFVAGGSDGVVLTSTDGSAWIQRTSGTAKSIVEVEYLTFNGSSAFYALTGGAILKSADGIVWTPVVPTGLPSDKYLTEITIGQGGTQLAVGSSEGYIYHTTDGTSWISIRPQKNVDDGLAWSSSINMLRWMKDRYIISDPSAWMWSSENLSSVSLMGSPFKQLTSDYGIHMFNGFYDGNKYYLFGSSSPYGYGAVYTSADATNWTMQPYTNEFTAQNSVFVNGKYFRVGNEGLQVSADGVNWAYKWGGIFNDILYDGTRYITVGKLGSEGNIWISADMIHWTQCTMSDRANTFYGVTSGGGGYVAVGYNASGKTALAYSGDAVSWTVNNSLSDGSEFYDVAYGNNKFVAAGSISNWSEPTIKVSADGGVTWNSAVLPAASTALGYPSVEFIHNQFVAIGCSGTSNSILTSPDGVTWTEHAGAYPNAADCLTSIIYADSKYTMLYWDYNTYELFIRTSTDLSSWSEPAAIPGAYYTNIMTSQIGKAGDNLYVLAYDDTWSRMTFFYSTDQGQTWQDSEMDTTLLAPYTVQTVGNNAVILGDAKLLMTTNIIPSDSDSTVSSAGIVTEPVLLPSTSANAGAAVDVVDFTISDSGTSDGLSTDISQIILGTSGTGDFSKVTWRLNGPDAGNVPGNYDPASHTVSFSGLGISIADGANETYTVNAYFNDNTGLTEGQTYMLSLNGSSATSFTVSESGSRMAAGQTEVTNGTGSAVMVTATKLVFSTQPTGSVSGRTLTTQPVIAATDAAGNIDIDFTGTITLSEETSGNLSGTASISADAGIAAFSDLAYTAAADHQSFELTASSGVLPEAISNTIQSDVVAVKLVFQTEPLPVTGQSGVSLSFTVAPVIRAVDADGLVDIDYHTGILLSVIDPNDGSIDGSVVSMTAEDDLDGSGTTVTAAPMNGVAGFNGLALQYTAGGASDTIALRASSESLTVANSEHITILSLPLILSITPPVDRIYTSGENLDFEVLFTRAVNVTDNAGANIPFIAVGLNTGGTVPAYCIGGSGTNTLTFRYTVTDGVEDPDGIVLTSPISLNTSGTIKDASGYDAVLTFILPDTSDILVDSIVPAAPVVSSITQDTGRSGSDGITNDQTLFINGTAEANSTVTIYLDSALIGTTTADASDSWSFDNTASVISQGTHTITAKATDVAGNAGSASLDYTLVIDTIAPDTPVIIGISDDSGESSADGITKDTSLIMNGISTAGAYVEVFDRNTDLSYGSTPADGSGNWSLDMTGLSLDEGTYQFEAVASDDASNLSASSAAYMVTVDTHAPNAASVSINSGNSHTSSSLVTLNLAAVGASGVMISESSGFTGASCEAYAASKSFHLSSGDGMKTIYVKYIDAAGNETEAISDTIVLDTVSPAVSISSTETDPTRNETIPVTIDFSESVSGFDADALIVANGNVSHFSGSGTTYTLNITALADGAVTVDIAGNMAQDGAGNGNTAAQQFSITVDTEEPSEGMIRINSDTPYTINATVTLTLSATGATHMMISEDSTFVGASYEVFATNKSFALSSGNGTKTVYVKFRDLAGNETSSISDSIVLDTVLPTAMLTSAEVSPTGSESIPVTITFSENVTGFDETDLTAGNGTIMNFAGSGAVYIVDIVPLADGTVTVNVNSNAAHDLAGNSNMAAASYSIVSDRSLPSVVISSTEVSSTSRADIPLTITFSESVSGFDMSDLGIVNGTADDFAGNGTIYTVNIIPSADGVITVDIADNAAQDIAGNGNTAASRFTIFSDRTVPEFSSVDASNLSSTAVSINVTMNEAGTIYFIAVLDGAAVPTSFEVKAGTAYGTTPIITSGNHRCNTSPFTWSFPITGLMPDTVYDVYFTAEDDETAPNLMSAPQKVSVHTPRIRITSFETLPAINAGYANDSIYPDANAVTAVLPASVTANGASVTIPVLSWTDIDGYDSSAAGSYTFTAVLGTLPYGYINDGLYTATVEVIVNALSAPTIQSATAGDTHVSIAWSSVPAANGYKVFKSTVSGSYNEAPVTVSESVYSYDATGLSNGTTYYFVVRASIGMHDSTNSNEVSSIPQVPAPQAPVLQTAAAGDRRVSLTWSPVEGSIGYRIYARPASGSYTPTPAMTVSESVYGGDVTGLTNGTLYCFVVTASNPGGESGYSNEIGVIPQVAAPNAPTGLTASGGNAKVTLSWDDMPGAANYIIYQSTVSGSYGTALGTVAGNVHSYEASGLANGVVYHFVIKASNAGGESPSSDEVSAMPGTVPGSPTNVAATAGNGHAVVRFVPPADNGGSPITGYTVTSSPGNITATGIGTTITVTGLSNGIVYTFTVTASNTFGIGPVSAASNAVIPNSPPTNDDNEDDGDVPPTPVPTAQPTPVPTAPPTPVPTAPPANSGVDILVNGKTETAATAETTQDGDKTIITIAMDDQKVEEKLKQEGNHAILTIPVQENADIVIGQLNGQTIKNMESKEAVLEIRTGQVSYTLPASQINIDDVSKQIGEQVELKDIKVSVKISEPPFDTVRIVEDTANNNNYQIVVQPISFEITCSSGNTTVEVSKFNAYIERLVAIPEGVDPSRITTGIVLNEDGSFSHVPTVITVIDGKYYAKISSLTNSTYSVIYNPKTFGDVETHWARETVNDMASRLIISGGTDGLFSPDREITRAEFASIVVRGLGLMRSGTGKDVFSDVVKNDWYYDAISIAHEYGILSGYGNGRFGPEDTITREQAMTMIARALKITGLKVSFESGEEEQLLAIFSDTGYASGWAKSSIASCIKAGIISGRSGKLIAPVNNITRAEVAVIVRKLLQKSGLI